MKLLARISLPAMLAGIVVAASSLPAPAALTPVVVKQCFVTPPKPLSKMAGGTQIDYVIFGHKNAESITFQVGYRNAANHYLRRVRDVGMFSPGAEIRHHFDLYKDVTYAGKTVQSCAPVSVKWADSTTWLAPAH